MNKEILILINQLADIIGYLTTAIEGIPRPFVDQVYRRTNEVIENIEKLNGGKLDYPRKGYYQE
jgi:hypothetical protein